MIKVSAAKKLKILRLHLQKIGQKGGKTTMERHGKRYFSQLSKKRKVHAGGRPRKAKPAK